MENEEDAVQYATEAESTSQASEDCEGTKTSTLSLPVNEDIEPERSLLNTMLDHVANNKVAHFKSQQVGEPDLSFDQKRQIAKEILERNPGQFLSRFGQYLLSDHLDYFQEIEMEDGNYEVSFHLHRLRRFHCKAKNEVDVKNRRYEALKKLVKEGSYFSEKEMKQRNPLLYQQLIGQYLTNKEIEDQRKADQDGINSWVALLLAQIERDQMECLRVRQKYDEEGAVEEVDTSDESEEEEEEMESEDEGSVDEMNDENEDVSCLTSGNNRTRKRLSGKEKDLLREEFVSNMYHSFLEGKDEDFDYSEVDLNPEYESLAVRSQDEEEKYFDSETPELVENDEKSMDGEEDELDVYMKNLKPEPTPCELAGTLNDLL